MDNIEDYEGLVSSVRDSNIEHIQKLEGAAESKKAKIEQLTDPIGEFLMSDSSKELLKKGVNNAIKKSVRGATNKLKALLKNQGLDVDDIEGAVNSFKNNGFEGLVNHIKNRTLVKNGFSPVGGDKTNIQDLTPEEFQANKETLQNGLLARRAALQDENPEAFKKMSRKYINERQEPYENPDPISRQQNNMAEYSRQLDRAEQEAKIQPEPQITKILTGTGDDDDDLIGQAQTSIRGFTRTAMNINKDADEAAESIASKGKGLLQGIKKAAEIDTEAGGIEDRGGDIVSAAIGIGTFLGGVFSSRHIHQQETAEQISNATYQEGA